MKLRSGRARIFQTSIDDYMFGETSPRPSRDKNKNKENEDIYLSEEIEDPQDSPTRKRRLTKPHLVVTTDSENECNDDKVESETETVHDQTAELVMHEPRKRRRDDSDIDTLSDDSDYSPTPENLFHFGDSSESEEICEPAKRSKRTMGQRAKKHEKRGIPRVLNSDNEDNVDDENDDADGIMQKDKRLSAEADNDEETVNSGFDEEEYDLDDSVILDKRMRGRRTSKYSDNLKQLLARKQGITLEDEENVDDVEEGEEMDKEASDEQNNSENVEDRDAPLDMNSYNDLDDFVVEEGENVDLSGLNFPAELTSSGSQSMKYHFQVFIQFLVYLNKFSYDELMADEYFSSSVKAVERKIDGYKNVLVASSAWAAYFKKALHRYPIYRAIRIQASPFCDACKSSRPSTYKVTLSGPKYHKDSLRASHYGSTSSASSISSSSAEEDQNDFRFTSKSTRTYHLGRFCQVRARVYHDFHHLKFHYFQRIHAEIQSRDFPEEKPEDIVTELDKREFTTIMYGQFEELCTNTERLYRNQPIKEYN
ncbi:11451_t:CDS:2 [Paraglomus brasilianum]|uniref:11451_t:CDS:1 n=1 Tax=Paraglomus brasilianum TaxID=144538 RepID=A0A9N9C4D8_9GLOM|nr:11451_t:CDS:2 [Paraglomus brasilianum]